MKASEWKRATQVAITVVLVCGAINPALAQEHPAIRACVESFEAGNWSAHEACLRKAQDAQRRELEAGWDFALQHARRSLSPDASVRALEDSAKQWRRYKASECLRRNAASAGRNHPNVTELNCDIRLNAVRIAHLRSED